MAKPIKQERKTPVRKRTSIGTYGVPLNKSKRRAWKRYNRQGRP